MTPDEIATNARAVVNRMERDEIALRFAVALAAKTPMPMPILMQYDMVEAGYVLADKFLAERARQRKEGV